MRIKVYNEWPDVFTPFGLFTFFGVSWLITDDIKNFEITLLNFTLEFFWDRDNK